MRNPPSKLMVLISKYNYSTQKSETIQPPQNINCGTCEYAEVDTDGEIYCHIDDKEIGVCMVKSIGRCDKWSLQSG